MTNASTAGASFVRTAGLLCLIGGVIGVISAVVMAFIPPAVSPDLYRYPFTLTGFLVAQFVFMSNHVLLSSAYSASPDPASPEPAFSGASDCGSRSPEWPLSRCAR